MASFSSSLNLRVMGFCGADDTCQPELLQLLSTHYSWIEWGVLFRPDLEGTARYASPAWVEKLASVNREGGQLMRLAAHLCGSRCQEVIGGDFAFAKTLLEKGFGRAQVNATAQNAVVVDAGDSQRYADNLMKGFEEVPGLEWILQYNSETKHIVDIILAKQNDGSLTATNFSVLYDASMGTGVAISSVDAPLAGVKCGYAGGLGPANIEAQLLKIAAVTGETSVWVDMESSLRTVVVDKKTGAEQDTFSVDKCFSCILVGVGFGLPVSRFTLLTI